MQNQFYIVSPLHEASRLMTKSSLGQSEFAADIDPTLVSHALTTAYIENSGVLIANGISTNTDIVKLQRGLNDVEIFPHYFTNTASGFQIDLNLLGDTTSLIEFRSGRNSSSLTVSSLEDLQLSADLTKASLVAFPSYHSQRADLKAHHSQTSDPESRICGYITGYLKEYFQAKLPDYSVAEIDAKFEKIDGCDNHLFLGLKTAVGDQYLIDASYKQFLASSLTRAELNDLPDVMAIKVTNKQYIEKQLASHGIGDSLKHIWTSSLVL